MSRTDQGKMKGRHLTGSTQKTATLLVTGMQGELKSLGKISAAQRQSRFVDTGQKQQLGNDCLT